MSDVSAVGEVCSTDGESSKVQFVTLEDAQVCVTERLNTDIHLVVVPQ